MCLVGAEFRSLAGAEELSVYLYYVACWVADEAIEIPTSLFAVRVSRLTVAWLLAERAALFAGLLVWLMRASRVRSRRSGCQSAAV